MLRQAGWPLSTLSGVELELRALGVPIAAGEHDAALTVLLGNAE